jgi:hypothetical protein
VGGSLEGGEEGRCGGQETLARSPRVLPHGFSLTHEHVSATQTNMSQHLESRSPQDPGSIKAIRLGRHGILPNRGKHQIC